MDEAYTDIFRQIENGSVGKSEWTATLRNGTEIKYSVINGAGVVSGDQKFTALLTGFLSDNATDSIPFSYFGSYPKDINDPVSVMLAIRYLYNEYEPIKYSGNYPDVSDYTELPSGTVE